jgi:hypothetical protein
VAPVANASATVGSVQCTAGGCADVTLDGSASTDADGTIVSYVWKDADGNAVASGAMATLNLALGAHTFTLTVKDDDGATSSTSVTVTVVDTQAPVVSFALPVTTLWSPSHKLEKVGTISAGDACDPTTGLAFSVTSNEALNGTGDGNTASDWYFEPKGDGSYDLWLRAERKGNGTDRVYTVTVTATDDSGNTTTKVGVVTVPKSQGK